MQEWLSKGEKITRTGITKSLPTEKVIDERRERIAKRKKIKAIPPEKGGVMQTSELEIELGKRGLTLCDADCGRVARRGYAYCAPCDERLAKPARYSNKYRFTVLQSRLPKSRNGACRDD